MRFSQLFLLATTASAAPTTPRRSAADLLQQVVAPPQSSQPHHSWADHPPDHYSTHLEPAPNSVGVLFTSAEEEDVVHLWLPLGQKLYTRDNPLIPLHPLTARITTLINSSPEEATPERLGEVECAIVPHVNRTTDAEKRWEARFGRGKGSSQQTERSVSFRKGDEMVRLSEAGSRFWMGGREVEGIECR